MPADQRRGQAFCALLEAVDPDRLPRHGGTATTVVVTIPVADLLAGLGVGVLGDGTRISAGEARRLACTAGLLPAILDGASQVLDLGRTRRLFTAAQRKALAVRQRTCRATGCTVPSTWCEAHHGGDPWSRGGRTDLADGVLLCSWHHHRAHDDRYLVQRTPDGARALPPTDVGPSARRTGSRRHVARHRVARHRLARHRLARHRAVDEGAPGSGEACPPQDSNERRSGGTSTEFSTSSSRGMTSSARSCVLASTIGAATPSSYACFQRAATTHQRSPGVRPGKCHSGRGVERSLPTDC